MQWWNNILWGFICSGIGIALPGLINMTAVKVALDKGFRKAVLFSCGAASTILLQATFSILFAGYLSTHAEVLSNIKKLAIVIFLLLAVVFLYQAMHPRVKKGSSRTGSAYWLGVMIAAMNVLNVPFYFTMGTVLSSSGTILLKGAIKWSFIFGLFLGGLVVLLGYACFAGFIQKHATYFTRNLNYFLSVLFLLLAIIQLVQLYYT